MTFVQAIQNGFKNYVQFNGRARRSEYWWWVLFVALIALIPDVMMQGEMARGAPGIGASLYGLVMLATFLPSLGLVVRRLHDTNHSGWWYLLIFTGIGALLILYWVIIKGTAGSNKYGADPLGNPTGVF